MSWVHRGRVAVIGVGFSATERPGRTPLSALTRTAIESAAAHAGLAVADLDGYATYPDAPYMGAQARSGIDTVPIEFVTRRLAREVRWSAQLSSGMVTAALTEASAALIAGLCHYAVVWRSVSLPTGGYNRSGEQAPGVGVQQFTAPWRIATPVQWHALAYRRYLERFGQHRDRLGALAVTSRAYARGNPHAIFQDRPLSTETYLDARMISEPLALFDCDVPVHASIAAVLTTSDRAADAATAAYIAAVASNTPSSPPRLHYTVDDHLERGGAVARSLWTRAGFGPTEVAVAQLYDGFAPSAIYWLEAAGFCRGGEGLDFIQDDRIGPDGPLPLNTFGGSLSAGRTHGMGHIAEAVLQVTGRGGSRQVPAAASACAFVGSPMLDGGAVVFTRDP
jgi:acetyl-CoA acetyltransferase